MELLQSLQDPLAAPTTAPENRASAEHDETGDRKLAELIDAAQDLWIRRLIDYSRNNSLLFFRDLKVGTLDLTRPAPALAALLAGQPIRADDLVPERNAASNNPEMAQRLEEQRERSVRDLNYRLIAIQRKAKLNDEEKGLQTLHLGVGLATWPTADDGRPYMAPVLLIPTTLTARSHEPPKLQISGEPRINPVLAYVLQDQHGVNLDVDAIQKACTREDDDGKWTIDPECAWQMTAEAAGGIRGFHVVERTILANLHFAKMAMVEDLRRNREALLDNPLVAAVAGHQPSRDDLAAPVQEISPTDLDQFSPHDEHLVLDADGSQMTAIRMICRGQNLVVEGPPGTGKSQTIANLIAQSVADGRRVLFVAEKRAALNAVIKRLREVELGHLVLDLHGASVSRRAIMADLAEAVDRIRQAGPAEQLDAIHREYEAARRRLNAHVERLHRPRAPEGLSLFTMMGKLLALPAEARTSVCFADDLLEEWTKEQIAQLHALLAEAAALSGLLVGGDPSPWARADIKDRETARRLSQASRDLNSQRWPEFERRFQQLLQRIPLPAPRTLAEAELSLELLGDFAELRTLYRPEFLRADLAGLCRAMEAARSGPVRWFVTLVRDRGARQARRQVRSLRSSPAPARQLLEEVRRGERAIRWWREAGNTGEPPEIEGLGELREAFSVVRDRLVPILQALGTDLAAIPTSEAGERIRVLAEDMQTPYRVPQAARISETLTEHGLGPLLQDLRARPIAPEQWSQRFDDARLRSAIHRALAREPELTEFDGSSHERLVEEFRRLDRERIRLAAHRVRRLHGEQVISAMNQHTDQTALLKKEVRKKSRHLSLRKLFARAPDVLTRVAPCWVASPLSVSQLLDGAHQYFDLVVFDEASQVLQEEAVPSLLRAKQVVVAGDRHQLPPTAFFATAIEGADDDGEDADETSPATTALEATSGFESLLDTLWSFLPNKPLLWHYRSCDERLIAFSNHYIYNGQLITFPSATADDVIAHVQEQSDPGLANQEESCSKEVHQVVQQVIRHALERPEESLGVITMGIKHANRVQAALDRELLLHPDLADFFILEKEERFFVKNLETVQGDERDAIILSIGYGKNPDGSLPHRFGPLTQEQGYRRLNVAITRARRRITLASSFSHLEVDLRRSSSRGVELLKGYLEYAASGGRRIPLLDAEGSVPPNPFESDVQDALSARGIPVVAQYGTSRYRIDLVAMHPKQTRPVLAIECDGAAYHSTAPARERDRLRQEHLQRLGWRFHRIWSTDWFFRREEEIERAVSAYQDAVRASEIEEQRQSDPPHVHSVDRLPSPAAPLPPAVSRGPAPRLPRHRDIAAYSDQHLIELAQWVCSDRLLRTDDEIVREMLEQLPFQRLGARIKDRLSAAVRRAHAL